MNDVTMIGIIIPDTDIAAHITQENGEKSGSARLGRRDACICDLWSKDAEKAYWERTTT